MGCQMGLGMSLGLSFQEGVGTGRVGCLRDAASLAAGTPRRVQEQPPVVQYLSDACQADYCVARFVHPQGNFQRVTGLGVGVGSVSSPACTLPRRR